LTSFRIVPKNGTLQGYVQTGTLQIERLKNGAIKKWYPKVERYTIVPFPSEQINRKHIYEWSLSDGQYWDLQLCAIVS